MCGYMAAIWYHRKRTRKRAKGPQQTLTTMTWSYDHGQPSTSQHSCCLSERAWSSLLVLKFCFTLLDKGWLCLWHSSIQYRCSNTKSETTEERGRSLWACSLARRNMTEKLVTKTEPLGRKKASVLGVKSQGLPKTIIWIVSLYKFSIKGQNVNLLGFLGHRSASTAQLGYCTHRQHIKKWVWLCCNETLRKKQA